MSDPAELPEFHDAVICRVEARDGDLFLHVEYAHGRTPDSPEEAGTLVLLGVSRVDDEGVPVAPDALGSGFDDASILTLDVEDEGRLLSMIVVWDRYAPRESRTAVHRIVAREICWRRAVEEPVADGLRTS